MMELDDESKKLWEAFRNTGDPKRKLKFADGALATSLLIDFYNGSETIKLFAGTPPEQTMTYPLTTGDMSGPTVSIVAHIPMDITLNYKTAEKLFDAYNKKGHPLTADEVRKLIGDSK